MMTQEQQEEADFERRRDPAYDDFRCECGALPDEEHDEDCAEEHNARAEAEHEDNELRGVWVPAAALEEVR